jgi:hypothetical protein
LSSRRRLEELERHAWQHVRPIIHTHPLVAPYRERFKEYALEAMTDLQVLSLTYFVGYVKNKETGDSSLLNEVEETALKISGSLGGEEKVRAEFEAEREIILLYWDIIHEELIRRDGGDGEEEDPWSGP